MRELADGGGDLRGDAYESEAFLPSAESQTVYKCSPTFGIVGTILLLRKRKCGNGGRARWHSDHYTLWAILGFLLHKRHTGYHKYTVQWQY